MKVKYINEGYFKSPAQAKIAQQKQREKSSAERIANTANRIISEKLLSILNGIFRDNVLVGDYEETKTIQFYIDDFVSIQIEGKDITDINNSSTRHNTPFDFDPNSFVSYAKLIDSKLHVGISINVIDNTGNENNILFVNLVNLTSTNSPSMYDKFSTRESVLDIFSNYFKEIISRDAGWALTRQSVVKNKNLDNTFYEMLNRYTSLDDDLFVVDDISLNYNKKNIVIGTEQPTYEVSMYSTVKRERIDTCLSKLIEAESNQVKIISNILGLADKKNVTFKFKSVIKEEFKELFKFPLDKKISDSIMITALSLKYKSPNLIEAYKNILNKNNSNINHIIYSLCHNYDSIGNLIDKDTFLFVTDVVLSYEGNGSSGSNDSYASLTIDRSFLPGKTYHNHYSSMEYPFKHVNFYFNIPGRTSARITRASLNKADSPIDEIKPEINTIFKIANDLFAANPEHNQTVTFLHSYFFN